MNRRQEPRLIEGKYQHPRCPSCRQETPEKQYLAPDVRWIFRRRFCRDVLVDYSISLQKQSPFGQRQDVTRFSVAHSNAHQYQCFRSSRVKTVLSGGPLDEVSDVHRAYREAIALSYPRTEEYIQAWEEGP